MYAIPWYVVLFESFPETILVFLLGFRLFNINIDIKKLILISILNCMFVYFIRQLPIPFGIHTLLLVIVCAVLSVIVAKIRFLHSLVSIMTGVIIMGVLQSLILPIILILFNVDILKLSSQPIFNIFVFVPLGFIMLAILFLLKKYNLVIYDLSIHEG